MLGRAQPGLLVGRQSWQLECEQQWQLQAVGFLLRGKLDEQFRVPEPIVWLAAVVTMRVIVVIVIHMVMTMWIVALAGGLMVVAMTLRVVELDVGVAAFVSTDDPVVAHRQRNCHDRAHPQQ